MWYGLKRDSATLHAVLATDPSRAEVWLTLFHKAGQCVAHTACRRRCSVRLERGFGGKPCHTYADACGRAHLVAVLRPSTNCQSSVFALPYCAHISVPCGH